MKYFRHLLLSTLAVTAVAATAQNSDIASFFNKAIKGDSVYYTPRKNKTVKDITRTQGEVWKQWCAAVRADEQQLIRLDTLSKSANGQWQVPENLEPHAVLNYYYGSKGARPAGGYPLFIYLHGSGPRAQEWATGLALAHRFQDSPSVYFIPQIPQEGEWYRWYQRSKQWFLERLLRYALADTTFNADRIYLFGISEGGYGSQRLASFYADYLAAAGPMAGGEPLKNAPAENLRNTPFSLRTGAEDYGFYRNYLTHLTLAALDSLGRLNSGEYHHWVNLEPKRGHSIDYTKTPTWLAQWTRRAQNKSVSWEDFEMDGRHRRGFANLQVLTRPTDAERTRYEERIADNTVSITVQAVDYEAVETDPQWGIQLCFARTYRPATNGRFVVYLSPELIDPAKPVRVEVNGKVVYDKKLTATTTSIVNSTACYGDPKRIYPYAVGVQIGK